MAKNIDVIVPVYNALDQVKDCINSLLEHANARVKIIIINDGSGQHVKDWLNKKIAKKSNCTVIHNPKNIGYLKSVNIGLSKSSADLVILQNSDTIVFDGFYDDVEATFEVDKKIGIVNAVSNWANWTRIPFPEGHTMQTLHKYVRSRFHQQIEDIGSASGFCFAIRREVLDDIGHLDTAFDPGYWEETDYCLKAISKGWRVVANLGLYVYHHGWSSFGVELRNKYMRSNEMLFRNRWHEEFSQLEQEYSINDPLFDQKIILNSNKDEIRSSRNLNVADKMRVLYVLPSLALYGGVLSVLQVVNQLIKRGVAANIAVIGDRREDALRYSPCHFKPMHFYDESDFFENVPDVDLIVATQWSTTFIVEKAHRAKKCRQTAYFVQDYEPDFYPSDPNRAKLAEFSYSLLTNRICKTKWLWNKLSAFGGRTQIIPLGLNTDVFANHHYPREDYVVSMARPSSERRNWPTTLNVFKEIHNKHPEIKLGVFGFGFNSGELPNFIKSFGLLSSAGDVSRLLNKSRILLDASLYQGFGRPGLEAMACGTVPVLTRNGGITAYASHRENCLLVDPTDERQIVDSILELYFDSQLYDNLRTNAEECGSRYALDREGELTISYFRDLLQN